MSGVLQKPILRDEADALKTLKADKYFSKPSVAMEHLVTLAEMQEGALQQVQKAHEQMLSTDGMHGEDKGRLEQAYVKWRAEARCAQAAVRS